MNCRVAPSWLARCKGCPLPLHTKLTLLVEGRNSDSITARHTCHDYCVLHLSNPFLVPSDWKSAYGILLDFCYPIIYLALQHHGHFPTRQTSTKLALVEARLGPEPQEAHTSCPSGSPTRHNLFHLKRK